MAARAQSASRTTRPVAPVTWRDGVHITGTQIWCDAGRARDICFVSSSDRVQPRRHGQVLATPAALALLHAASRTTGSAELPIPCGRPFTLGSHRLELVRSGHAFGSASLLVEIDGHRILYAGAVCGDGGPLAGTMDTRRADTLVIAARYGQTQHPFVSPADALAQLAELRDQVLAKSGSLVVFVATPEKALEVLATQTSDSVALAADASIQKVARAANVLVPTLRTPTAIRSSVPKSALILWPWSRRGAPALRTLPAHSATVLLSGLAAVAEFARAAGTDYAIPFSSHLDVEGLGRYVDACGARRVFVTDHANEVVLQTLQRPGREVSTLGPPRQLTLFSDEC